MPNFRDLPIRRNPWLGFLAPFAIYSIVGYFEPQPPASQADRTPTTAADSGQKDAQSGDTDSAASEDTANGPSSARSTGLFTRFDYPTVYIIKLGLTLAAILFFWPNYREFPPRVGWLALGGGVVGAVLWIGLCQLRLEETWGPRLGLGKLVSANARPAFDPFAEFGANHVTLYGFLAARFVGLALVVPLIEEFMLRGFVMRFCLSNEWWKVPFGAVTRLSLAVGTLLPMGYHPSELVAALVWFTGVSWLMVRTKNLWDCVAAHAVTNLLLGVYIVSTGTWRLW